MLDHLGQPLTPLMRDRVARAWAPEEPPENFVPGCFPNKERFVLWLEAFVKPTDPTGTTTFCSDCTFEHQIKMKAKHRCAFPNTTFAISATDGWMEGTRTP